MFQNNKNALTNNPLFMESKAGKNLSEKPLGFVDVGARGGLHDIVMPLAQHTAVLGFEPDKQECERLKSIPEAVSPWAKFELLDVALGEHEEEQDLYLLTSPTNHSLLPSNQDFVQRYKMDKWHIEGKTSVHTVTLDDALKTLPESNWGEIIKLDAQGTEYEILKGSINTLRDNTTAIMTEVAFCELYKNQKLFSEVELLMRENGFSFYGFMPIHTRSQKQLDKKQHATIERAFYADAIFFKDPLLGSPLTGKFSERDAYTLFTNALLLHYYDYALELSRATWLLSSDKEENERVVTLIEDLSRIKPTSTQTLLTELVQNVEKNPEMTNVLVGGFVDSRRKINDYDDVLDVSPLPTTL